MLMTLINITIIVTSSQCTLNVKSVVPLVTSCHQLRCDDGIWEHFLVKHLKSIPHLLSQPGAVILWQLWWSAGRRPRWRLWCCILVPRESCGPTSQHFSPWCTDTDSLHALSQVVAGAEEVVFLSRTPTRTPLLELINTVYQLAY